MPMSCEASLKTPTAAPRRLAPRVAGCVSRGGGGGGAKGLWAPAPEPPTPCVPRGYDCALRVSALHRASAAWRWRSVRAYSVLGST
jgi:hypothetical protein